MNNDRPLAAIGRRLQQRAWSRAGAVAAVVSAGPTRRVLTFSTRLIVLVTGSFVIATSVAITLWDGLGAGPLDMFIGAIRERTGLPLTMAVWATVGSLIAIAAMLGRRPGLGTILAPLLIGPMMQTMLVGLGQFDAPGSQIVRIGLHIVAIAGIGIGAGALIVSGLGAGSGELLASAAADKVDHPETRVRSAIELTWVVAGIALGGPAGLGTVLVAVLIGPAVAHGYRVVDSLAAASMHTVTNTHEVIIARELVRSG